MKAYGVNELRRMFLDFFESKGHLKMKSFSLVPHNDNSLLLINAGHVLIQLPIRRVKTGKVLCGLLALLFARLKKDAPAQETA